MLVRARARRERCERKREGREVVGPEAASRERNYVGVTGAGAEIARGEEQRQRRGKTKAAEGPSRVVDPLTW